MPRSNIFWGKEAKTVTLLWSIKAHKEQNAEWQFQSFQHGKEQCVCTAETCH